MRVKVREAWSVSDAAGKQHMEYVISVARASNGANWTVRRRYKEFENLQSALRRRLAAAHPNLAIPKLPGKRYIKFRNADPEFISARREGLNAFLEHVMADSRFQSAPEVRSAWPCLLAWMTRAPTPLL